MLSELNQWKRAVIHIEAVGTSEEQSAARAKNEPYETRDVRSRGSAIFLEHEGRKYLLTAWHLLHDRIREDQVYTLICRVPTLEEYLSASNPRNKPKFIMNASAGPSWGHPYTFDAKNDLALVCISPFPQFTAEVEKFGAMPLTIDDFADGPSGEEAAVTVIGFPRSVAELLEAPLSSEDKAWASTAVSLPVISRGHVCMMHSRLPFFWCDVSAYPGNSGGPVFERGKVVGVVTSGGSLPIEWQSVPLDDPTFRIPFARATKSSFIRPLLSDLSTRKLDLREAPAV